MKKIIRWVVTIVYIALVAKILVGLNPADGLYAAAVIGSILEILILSLVFVFIYRKTR